MFEFRTEDPDAVRSSEFSLISRLLVWVIDLLKISKGFNKIP